MLGVKLGPELATSTFNNQLLTLYPNPAKTILQLQSSNDIAFNKIIITDSTGKIVVEQTANTNQINIKNWPLVCIVLKPIQVRENSVRNL